VVHTLRSLCPQRRFDPRDQFSDLDRLDKIILRPLFQAFNGRGEAGKPGQHDDLDRWIELRDVSARFDAVTLGSGASFGFTGADGAFAIGTSAGAGAGFGTFGTIGFIG
jgi:hypothetical protein